jgi:hypothetical protein
VVEESTTEAEAAVVTAPDGSDVPRRGTVLPSGWDKSIADDGDKFYFNETTGETQWDAPPGSVGGSSGK